MELKSKGVQVMVVEPGGFRTDFSKNIVWASGNSNISSMFKEEFNGFLSTFRYLSTRPKSQSPNSVAKTIVKLSEQDTMPLRVQVGKDSISTYLAKKILPQKLFINIRINAMNKLRRQAERVIK